MQCYESEKLAGYAVDSDFSHTNVAVPALYRNCLAYLKRQDKEKK